MSSQEQKSAQSDIRRDRASDIATEITREIENGLVAGPGKPAGVRQEHLKLRSASVEENDADLIRSWLMDEEDFEFLGGDRNIDWLPQVKKWISDALATFVLEDDGKPVAFMALEMPDENEGLRESFMSLDISSSEPNRYRDISIIEFGRVIVRPDNRAQGYGTTMFAYILDIYMKNETVKAGGSICMVARTNNQNVAGVNLINKLPLHRLLWHVDPDYEWFSTVRGDLGECPSRS